MEKKDLIQITKDYYDSKEADEFYFHIWGGEDIHIGIYEEEGDTIREASRKTILKMLAIGPKLGKSSKVLDIGSGYGGAARYIAKKYGCTVQCLNLSETENQRNIEFTQSEDLADIVKVTTGNFEHLSFDAESFDLVWSQDALLHSNQKEKVFWEVARVLKRGGRFLFTDPMQSDDCPEGVLEKVLARIHLEELGSVAGYLRMADGADLERVFVRELPEQLVIHYSRVLSELTNRYDEMIEKSHKTYIDNMITGLNHWIEAGKKSYLNWGILQFQKRNL